MRKACTAPAAADEHGTQTAASWQRAGGIARIREKNKYHMVSIMENAITTFNLTWSNYENDRMNIASILNPNPGSDTNHEMRTIDYANYLAQLANPNIKDTNKTSNATFEDKLNNNQKFKRDIPIFQRKTFLTLHDETIDCQTIDTHCDNTPATLFLVIGLRRKIPLRLHSTTTVSLYFHL